MKTKFIATILTLFALLFTSCRPSVNPNEWVVSTATCWNTMTVSKAGDFIPRLITACDRMVVLPATELAADFTAETKFDGRVGGTVNVTYQWRIVDPITFIQSAKSITSSPTTEGNKIDPNALEAIENAVVDKMLVDLIREYTPTKEAGIDELEVEKDLNKLSETEFRNRGVEIYNMSINITFTQQTEEALDVISALRFYERNNELELGREVIKAKAGATKVTVDTQK
jgi:hypothetical protein